jgi:hypothetical protein
VYETPWAAEGNEKFVALLMFILSGHLSRLTKKGSRVVDGAAEEYFYSEKGVTDEH